MMDGEGEARQAMSSVSTEALVAEVLSEDPCYPTGTLFLDATYPTASASMLDAIREERVFVVVLPDRTEVAFAPRMDPIARIRRRVWWPALRGRAKTKPSVVIDEGGGYDISPPTGFTVHLRHPVSPAGC